MARDDIATWIPSQGSLCSYVLTDSSDDMSAGALIYQKASLGASAKQRHPQSGSITGRQLSSSHSFAARPLLRLHLPRSPSSRPSQLPFISTLSSRPIRFRPPCFSARPYSHRSHFLLQPSRPSIAPIPGRELRRLRGSRPLSTHSQPPPTASAAGLSHESPLWGLSQLGAWHHSSGNGHPHAAGSWQTGRQPSRRAGLRDCVRDSHRSSFQDPQRPSEGMQTSSGTHASHMWRGAGSERRMTSFQAGVAELCRDERAQPAQHAQRSRADAGHMRVHTWGERSGDAVGDGLDRLHARSRSRPGACSACALILSCAITKEKGGLYQPPPPAPLGSPLSPPPAPVAEFITDTMLPLMHGGSIKAYFKCQCNGQLVFID